MDLCRFSIQSKLSTHFDSNFNGRASNYLGFLIGATANTRPERHFPKRESAPQGSRNLMAGGSMFEGCLSADITASLRSGVGSWNETAAGQRLARVLVKVESKRRAGTGASSLDEFWASGDHLNGTVSVEFVQPVTIVRARVSLEGVCRIHVRVHDPSSQTRTIPKLFAYKFLAQIHQLTPADFVQGATDGSGATRASAPFNFSISYAALTRSSDVPQQCLQLPPSMTVGAVLHDENSGHSYAQPRISYFLVADIEIRSGIGHSTTISGSREIPIQSFGAPSPPIDTRDFPAEFVEKLSRPCRPHRLRKETFLAIVSSSEPSPTKLMDRKTPGNATCKLSVTLADTRSGSDIGRLMEVSSNIRLSVTPALRIKTFYSVSPFSKTPGQTMLTINGPTMLHDELRKLSSTSYSNLGWHSESSSDRTHAIESLSASTAVFATVLVELRLPEGLSPSFCSAVVARQYSLILQCKLKGVQVDSFGLELPLQIFYGSLKDPQKLDNAETGHTTAPTALEGSTVAQIVERSEMHSSTVPSGQHESSPSPPDYGP